MESKNDNLIKKVLELADVDSIGDPELPLGCATKSLQNISQALEREGYKASHTKVGKILKLEGFSLQATRKRNEGKHHVDRDKQFQYINDKTVVFQK